MSKGKLSATAREILSIVVDFGGECDGWGEIESHAEPSEAGSHLGHRNFERCGEALIKRGLIKRDDLGIQITDAGRAALEGRS